MIYNNIKFKSIGRNVNLEFYTRITLLSGDSGIGKTLLFQILSKINMLEQYKNITCINTELVRLSKINVLSSIQKLKNNFIIIDNSEILLGSHERKYILQDTNNQYLIIGRDRAGLGIGDYSYGELTVTEKEITIEYPYKKLVEEAIKFGKGAIQLP